MSATTFTNYDALSIELSKLAETIKKGVNPSYEKLANAFYQICMLPEIKHLRLDTMKRNVCEKKKKSVFVGYHQKSIGVLNIYEIFMKIKYPYSPSITGKLLSSSNSNTKNIKELESNLEKLEKMKNHPSVISLYEMTKKNIEQKLIDEKNKKIVTISILDCLIVSEKIMNIMASDDNKQMSTLLYSLYTSPEEKKKSIPENFKKPSEKSSDFNKKNMNYGGNNRWQKKENKKVMPSIASEKNTMGVYDLGSVIASKLAEKNKQPDRSEGWTDVKSKNKAYVPPFKRQENVNVKKTEFTIPFKVKYSKDSRTESSRNGYISLATQLKMKKKENELLNPESFPELVSQVKNTLNTVNSVWTPKPDNGDSDCDDVNDWENVDIISVDSPKKISDKKKTSSKKVSRKNTIMRCYTKESFYEPIGIEYSTGRLIVIFNGDEDKWTMEQLRFYDPSCFAPIYETEEDFLEDNDTYGNTFNTEDDDYIYSDYELEGYLKNFCNKRPPFYKRCPYTYNVVPIPVQYIANETETESIPQLEILKPDGFISQNQKCVLRNRT